MGIRYWWPVPVFCCRKIFMCCSPIAFSDFCLGVLIPTKCSLTLCVFGRSDDSGLVFRLFQSQVLPDVLVYSAHSSLDRSNQQAFLESAPMSWNLLQCLCGLISIPAAILVASIDCCWALWMIASFDVESQSCYFLEIYSSSVGNDVMLFDSFRNSSGLIFLTFSQCHPATMLDGFRSIESLLGHAFCRPSP